MALPRASTMYQATKFEDKLFTRRIAIKGICPSRKVGEK
jgi:hypothetical protein